MTALHLDHFEQQLPRDILQRGFAYFQQGYISQPRAAADGRQTFTAYGTSTYTVQVQLRQQDIVSCDCSCPYPEAICKHVVAALYRLRESETPESSRQPASDIGQQIDDMLNQLPAEQLKAFVREQAGRDSIFRQLLLSRFSYLLEEQSKAFYARQIRALLQQAKGPQEHAANTALAFLAAPLGQMIAHAGLLMEEGHQDAALHLLQAVMEETTAALRATEDASGVLSHCLQDTMQLLKNWVADAPDEVLKAALLHYTSQAFHKRLLAGLDEHAGMLSLAIALAETPEQAAALLRLTEQTVHTRSEEEALVPMQLALIQRVKGAQAVQHFMQQKKRLPFIRRQLLQQALDKQQWQAARALAQEGIHQDQRFPALKAEWEVWLQRISGAENS